MENQYYVTLQRSTQTIIDLQFYRPGLIDVSINQRWKCPVQGVSDYLEIKAKFFLIDRRFLPPQSRDRAASSLPNKQPMLPQTKHL